MSTLIRVTPEAAQALLADGYTYLDVRTPEEFAAGHPPGAVNAPVSLRGAGGLEPNAEFTDAVSGRFARDAKLLLGCRSGARSLKAAGLLEAAGFTALRELRTGFEGSRDAFGRTEPGWGPSGLPVETGEPEGRRWVDLRPRQG